MTTLDQPVRTGAPGVRPARARRGRWLWALVLVLPVAAYAGLRSAGSDARLVAADGGMVVLPQGRIEVDDDGEFVMEYRQQVPPPPLAARVRVRNTGRVPVTVTYVTDQAPGEPQDAPTTTVRVPARGTAWLPFRFADHGCGFAPVRPGERPGFVTKTGIDVVAKRPGVPSRHESIALPFGLSVASVLNACIRVSP